MQKTEWTDEQENFLRENYHLMQLKDLESHLGISQTVIGRKAKELGLGSKTVKNRIEFQFKRSTCELLADLHFKQNMSVNEISEFLGVSRIWVYAEMESCNIEWRGQAEAQKLVWEKRDEVERQSQYEAAHQKSKELIDAGKSPLKRWKEENPEKARLRDQRNAKQMSITRERNGNNWMRGRVGPLCPGWKGGKDEYHRLRGLADGNWRLNREKALMRDAHTCQRCGASGGDVIIDVHHIIPLRSGGTNLCSNLACYCRSCHKIVENSLT